MTQLTQDEVWEKLAEKYGRSGEEHYLRILKSLMNVDEGRLILELSEPVTVEGLAGGLNMDVKELGAKLDAMARRGLVFRGKTQYVARRDGHQMSARPMFSSDEDIPAESVKLRREDQRYAGSPHAEINGWLKRFEAIGVPLLRVSHTVKRLLPAPRSRPIRCSGTKTSPR